MKNMMKLLAALLAVMMLILAAPAAFAEDAQATEQSAPEVQTPAEEPARETEAPAEESKPVETSEPETTAEPTAEAAAEPAIEPTAETTVEAAVEPAIEPTAETTVEAAVEPAVEAQPEATPAAAEVTEAAERSVKIITDDSALQVGETLTLTAKISGFDGVEYSLGWQVKTEGGDWENLSGEHSATLKVKLDDSNVGASWRVVVNTAD